MDGEEPREDPGDVPVDDRGAAAEGDARDGASRVGPDPLEPAELLEPARHHPVVLERHRLRGGVEHTGAAVVAKAAPEGEHALFGGLRQLPDRGELPQKPLVVGDDGARAGLLEHRLADPDGVGVACPSPGQVPAGHQKPRQDRRSKGGAGARFLQGGAGARPDQGTGARLLQGRQTGGAALCRRSSANHGARWRSMYTPEDFLPDRQCAMFAPCRW